MNKKRLLDRLTLIGIELEADKMEWEGGLASMKIIEALLDYVNDLEIRDKVESIPF